MKYCPKCFVSLDTAAYACSAPHCAKAGVPLAESDLLWDEKKNPLCPACKSRLTVKVCTECGFELDADDMSHSLYPISIVGAHGCGKSNYLSVLVDQIGDQLCKVYGCALYPTGGDRTMDYFERSYRRPLFEQGTVVPTTQQEDIDPLTYTLVFGADNAAGSTCNLTFYDAAGANFESERLMARHNRSIYNSKGILFLIDPSQLPVLRESFRAKGLPTIDSDPQALLLRTVHLIRAGLSMDSVTSKIPIPIAVCLTKLDMLHSYLDPACFLSDSSRNLRRAMISSADISSCNLEVMSLIESWGGHEFLGHVESQFSDFGFFAFSALGARPGDQGEIPRVSPHRALDPFLWLLWRNKIIRAG